MKIFWILIFSLMFHSQASRAACAFFKATVEGMTLDGRVSQQKTEVIYAGEKLPVSSLNKKRTHAAIVMGSKKIIVPVSSIRIIQEKCNSRYVTTKEDVSLFLSPSKVTQISGEEIKSGEEVVILSIMSKEGSEWKRVQSKTGEYRWLPPSFSLDQDKVVLVAPQNPTYQTGGLKDWFDEKRIKGLRFGIEASLLTDIDAKAYDDLKTSIPNPNNVGSLQDPLITDVKKGEGYALRLIGIYPPSEKVQLHSALGYRQQSFDYVVRDNPSTGAVTLDSLPARTETIESSQLRLEFGAGFKKDWSDWSLGYGLQLAAVHNLAPEYKRSILTAGMVFKNAPGEVRAGPDAWDFDAQLRLSLRRKWLGIFFEVNPDLEMAMGLGIYF